MDFALLAVVGSLAGLLGSLVGLGGGVIVVPVLSLFLGVPIHQAIAASAVSVIATSTTGAISYVKCEYSNIRLGITLETATTIGAMIGGLTAAALSREALSGAFGVVLVLMSGYLLYRRRQGTLQPYLADTPGTFGGRYYDPHACEEVCYRVRNVPAGLAASLVAGNLSGLLGIGGGVVKVPVMTLAMGVPMRAAAATSNFMIGVTGCASAYIYYTRGFVNPLVAGPIALGTTLGAMLGTRLAARVGGGTLTLALCLVLLVFAVQMGLAAIGIRVR
ncbi:MAG: sulfite exporter TauE/SafE family protein [Anaerolineae bacterium]